MAKKGKKKSSGEKKIPRVQQLKQKEKNSKRNSWITSLVTILVIAVLAIVWTISNNTNEIGEKFVSKYDAFACMIPNTWTTYSLNETIKFDGSLGESSHPHLFAPKSVDIGTSDTGTNIPTLSVDPEFLEALEKNQGGKASEEINKQLTEQLKGQAKVGEGKPETDLNLTVLSAAIFNDEKSDSDINKYIGGIGGINNPIDYYLNKLEIEGTKIPGVEYGYYKLLNGSHPTGIIKTGKHTIIFNGIIAEGYEDDLKAIFESIKVP